MKAKLLSLFLLAALLLTAVPVSLAADTPSAAADEQGTVDLHTLYVTDGLVSLFSALAGEGDSVSLADGTWRDRITGASATLGNKQYWERRTDGAVGFDILYGVSGAEGVTLASDPTQPLPTDRYAPTAAYAQTRLDLGLSLLPTDDFTVEYVARYLPIYVADENGGIAKNRDGSNMELFVALGKGAPNAENAGPADHIGFLSSFATERDGTWGTTLRDRGAVLWCLTDNAAPTWETAPWIGLDARGGGGMRGAFAQRDGIHTYAITRDETRKEDGALTAVYALLRDRASFKKSLTVSTAKTQEGHVYYDKDDVGAFYLSSQTPTDFYSVRIYDRLLNEEEMAHNLLVDKLLYYGLSIPKTLFADETKMKIVYDAVSREGFLTDSVARAAKAIELQAVVDGEAIRESILPLYAARESLVALFTTSVWGTVNLKDGKWTDLVSGAVATLGTPASWHQGKYGGVGYETFCGELDAGGHFNSESAGNSYKTTATRLSLGTSILPKGDLTVDYLAMYKPVYLYDVRAEDHIARDADGVPLETYDFDPEATGLHLEKTAIDQIGWFSSYESSCDGIGHKSWGSAPRGSVHWFFNCNEWYARHNGTGTNANWLGKKWTAAGGLNRLDDTLRQNNVVQTYSITLDETMTVKEDGTRVTTALFSLYRDTRFYNSNANENALNSTANGEGYLGYMDIDARETGGFWLSATHPTDFFCVRVYNKALTEAELLHNRTADLLCYYGVAIPDALYGNDAAMAALGALLADTPFATDAAAFAAARATVEAALASLTRTVTLTLDGEVAGTLTAVLDRVLLPSTVAGKTVLALAAGDKSYAPDTAVTLEAGTASLTVLAVSLPTAIATPTAYVTQREEELGLRFAASLAKVDYATLVSLYGEAGVRIGILISPLVYVEMAGGVFTREALTAMVAEKGSASGAAFVEVVSHLDTSRSEIPVAGVLVRFHATTYQKNPVFTAVAFIDVDENGDGVFDRTLYGAHDGANTATVKDALTLARPTLPALAQGWIDTHLSRFGA